MTMTRPVLSLLLALALALPVGGPPGGGVGGGVVGVSTARAEGEIAGPDVVPVYKLATVRTTVEADAFLWFVFPMETSDEADQADPRVFQFTGAPGRHDVFLFPLKDGKKTGKYHKVVVIGTTPVPPVPPPGPTPVPPGPTPGPTPPPTPPSPSGFGLRDHILEQSRYVAAPERARGAGPLAAAYRETVRLARDGRFATAQDVINDARDRVAAVRIPAWAAVSLAPRLSALAKAGKIATVFDVTTAFEEIAGAYQEVADGG
jgi:hypothetical protein